MEKLELKYLAPYLTYGLRFDNGRDYEKDYLLGIRANGYNVPMAQGSRDSDYFRFERIKPILRPLSDLTKEIEHNGERFVPCDFFVKSVENMLKNIDVDLDCIPYNVIKKLFEWNFDVFGLIEKGLAIDINTLDK